jgi:hypothetical protein
MYHGSANQSYANIRSAVLHEEFAPNTPGFLTDPTIDTPELHGANVKDFATSYVSHHLY